MLAALALADYNVLDEWRTKMGGTVKSTVDPMTGHVSSLHRASSGTGWGGYEDGWDEELEARASAKAAKQKEREKKAKKVHAQRKAIQDRLTRKGGAARDAAEMV